MSNVAEYSECGHCWPFKPAVGDLSKYDEVIECPTCSRKIGLQHEDPEKSMINKSQTENPTTEDA